LTGVCLEFDFLRRQNLPEAPVNSFRPRSQRAFLAVEGVLPEVEVRQVDPDAAGEVD
jgi:hypothetical protein